MQLIITKTYIRKKNHSQDLIQKLDLQSDIIMNSFSQVIKTWYFRPYVSNSRCQDWTLSWKHIKTKTIRSLHFGNYSLTNISLHNTRMSLDRIATHRKRIASHRRCNGVGCISYLLHISVKERKLNAIAKAVKSAGQRTAA